jgi:hypothetical protein
MTTLTPAMFLDRDDRRVLAEDGQPGMDAKAGMGSTTELMVAEVAALLYRYGTTLNRRQLDDIIRWAELCKTQTTML